MHVTSLQSFYAAAAGVAGALIGLLFVAVSVAHGGPDDDPQLRHQIPAAAALTAFTNALCVSLFGLIEHGRLAIPAAAAGVTGLGFVLAALLSLIRRRRFRGGDLAILALMAAVFALQAIVGFSHEATPGSAEAQQDLAIIIVVCFLAGIGRSWDLIGARRIRLMREIGALALTRRDGADLIAVRADGPARRPTGWAPSERMSVTGAAQALPNRYRATLSES